MLYGSKLQIPPINSHLLAAQKEPHKKAKLLTKDGVELCGENKSGEWAISRTMAGKKEQQDWVEEHERSQEKWNPMTALRFQTEGRR